MKYDVETEGVGFQQISPIEADYFLIDHDNKTVRFYKTTTNLPQRSVYMITKTNENPDELVGYFTGVRFVKPTHE